MKKILLVLSLLSVTLISSAQYRIMGYYPNGAYGDYVIVYGYHDSSGNFILSHCRTNAVSGNIYSNNTYLDINTCEIRTVTSLDTPGTPAVSPPPAPALQKAF